MRYSHCLHCTRLIRFLNGKWRHQDTGDTLCRNGADTATEEVK